MKDRPFNNTNGEWSSKAVIDLLEQNKDEKRNLKSWAVKLPEEVIEEIEKLHRASGLRFKNEFIEYLVKQYEVNLFQEGKQTAELLHPEVLKNSTSDLHDIGKLTQTMHELFVQRLKKESLAQYELERVKKEYKNLLEQHLALQDMVGTPQTSSYLEDHVRKEIRQGFGHRLFVGAPGVGKGVAAKWEIKKALEQKRHVMVFDPSGEYDAMVQQVGGMTYHGQSEKGDRINPFEFRPTPNMSLSEKILEIYNLIELMLHRTTSARERKVLLSAIERSYAQFGITDDAVTVAEQMPTLKTLDKDLRKWEEGVGLSDELEPYIDGFLSHFNGERNFHLYDCPMISFNVKNLERDMMPLSAYVILSFIFDFIKSGVNSNTLLVIEETWLFMQHPQLRDLLLNVLKESKKYGVELLLITQSVEDVMGDDSLMMNIPTKVYFRHSVKELNRLVEHRLLSESETELLRTLKPGQALVDGNLKFMITFEMWGTNYSKHSVLKKRSTGAFFIGLILFSFGFRK